MKRLIEFQMTISDSMHHIHKVTGISKKGCTTTLVLDDGSEFTLEDHDVETKEFIEVYGSNGVDYYVSVRKCS